MNVEIVTEAAQFPEKEYISGIFLAVWALMFLSDIRSWEQIFLCDFHSWALQTSMQAGKATTV